MQPDDMTYSQYLSDLKTRLAVERAVEIIGEAARNIPEGFKQAHPEIPWKGIIGQRNVLAHEYSAIKHERIWKVVTVYIPDLIAKLDPLIPPLPAETKE
jgi:uncharacterized protein with HEPN domain